MTAQRSHFFSFPAFLRATVCGAMAISLLDGGSLIASASAAETSSLINEVADPIAAFVTEASLRFGVPEAWISAVMQAESAGDAQAVSPKGAMGLMQIMPDTWAYLRDRYGLGVDPYDFRDNSLVALRISASCLTATPHRVFWPPITRVSGALWRLSRDW